MGASYHKRLLSGAGSKSLQMQRPGTADTAVESSQTTQDISTPQATAQQEATAPAAGSELSPHAEVGQAAVSQWQGTDHSYHETLSVNALGSTSCHAKPSIRARC